MHFLQRYLCPTNRCGKRFFERKTPCVLKGQGLKYGKINAMGDGRMRKSFNLGKRDLLRENCGFCGPQWALWLLLKGKRGVLKWLTLRSRPPFTGGPRGLGQKVPHRVLFECFWAPGSECPKECFSRAFGHFWGSKSTKSFGALHARCPKPLKKHSVGHFPARAPGHSCEWWPG